jgi:beta-phosphoglucomutase-like phosphatase (HAD superfamily)
VAPILAQLPPETFSVIVTGDQVSNGKPHPEPYETAAAALGVLPRECLAIEDSNTGAKSAEAAGCTVLVVENHVPVLAGERRIFRPTLAGITAADLPALLP